MTQDTTNAPNNQQSEPENQEKPMVEEFGQLQYSKEIDSGPAAQFLSPVHNKKSKRSNQAALVDQRDQLSKIGLLSNAERRITWAL